MSTTVEIDTRKNPSQCSRPNESEAKFPSTRYQGCKRQIVNQIWNSLNDREFDSILDLFGGTGVVSYKAKAENKRVVYNDLLSFNHQIGKALIENQQCRLSQKEIDALLKFDLDSYPSVIQSEFSGTYFTDDENAWLDKMRKNIVVKLDDEYKKAIVFSAIGQACLTKRPYALFHRANLYMRENDVERSFGNKATWDRPFEYYFRKFIGEFNNAVFHRGDGHEVFNEDATNWTAPQTDLVYLDPPYYAKNKSNPVSDYHLYYHFLEGYMRYSEWQHLIDHTVKTKKIDYDRGPWNKPESIYETFDTIFSRYADRDIVLSYNSESLPVPNEISNLLATYKQNVEVIDIDHRYSLNSDESISELIFVGYGKQ